MGKIAFLFSGQGAQYVGMGKELYENIAESKAVFDEATKILNLDMKELCFEGPESELNKTENTQPAVLTVSIAALAALKARGIKADITAGFSLGEYSALIYSGALNFADGVELVKKRGKYMQEAVPEGIGAMAAIIGLTKEAVIDICKASAEKGVVEAVNFNCPGQIVVAGEVAAVNRAIELSKEKGAMKAVLLPVSAPFHSSMLSSAADKLKEELKNIHFNNLSIPMFTNLYGDYIKASEDILDILPKQAMNAVLWENIIIKMLEEGVDTFVEIGPGRTLSSFVKKISRKVQTLNVEDLNSLEKTINALKEANS